MLDSSSLCAYPAVNDAEWQLAISPLEGPWLLGGLMKRMNVAYWCRVTRFLRDAREIQTYTPFPEAYQRLFPIAGIIYTNHIDATSLVKLRISGPSAFALGAIVHEAIKEPTRGDPLTVDEVAKLRKAISDYEQVLDAELQAIDAYYVMQQGAYSTETLLENAETAIALPPAALPLLTEEMKADVREAGRCLVFGLATACGFHIARATETAIRSLMEAAGCPPPKDSQRNWGHYIKSLTDNNVDQKITHHLAQIKDLHRNPLIHPEQTLTTAEALALWSVCTSLMCTMLVDAQKRVAATVPALPPGSPPP